MSSLIQTSKGSSDPKAIIQEMITKASQLLGPLIEKTAASDRRAKTHGKKWPGRHRLLVLLDAAERSLETLPKAIEEPWLLAELWHILRLMEKMKAGAMWRIIEPCLVDPTSFSHSVAILMMSHHFELGDFPVRLVPNRLEASPDLEVRTKGGNRSWVRIECYIPEALAGEPRRITKEDASRILNKTLRKSKRQLGSKRPGIVAICAYNQVPDYIGALKNVSRQRLSRISRHNLLGLIIFSQNIIMTALDGQLVFLPRLHFEFIGNHSYRGPIKFSLDDSHNQHESTVTPVRITGLGSRTLLTRKVLKKYQ